MGAVAQRVTVCGGMFCKSVHVFDFKCKVCEIRADLDRTACIEFAYFNQLLASGSFEKNELGPATACETPDFFQSENVFVKGNGFLQIGNPVAGVEELCYHVLVFSQPGAVVKEENDGLCFFMNPSCRFFCIPVV